MNFQSLRQVSQKVALKQQNPRWLEGSAKEWVMGFFLSHGGERPVAGAEQGVCRQGKNLLANLLPGQVPGLKTGADRPGKKRVAHHGHVRSILRPGADDVSHAILRVAGSVAIRDAQAAEVKEIVRAIPLLRRRALRTRMHMRARILLAQACQPADVVLVGVREKK